MPNKLAGSSPIVLLQVFLIAFAGYSLWYRIFLPAAYYLVAILIAALIAAQLATGNNKHILLQIALLYTFTCSVCYIAANYQIIPFSDPNWDYAVVETMIREGSIFVGGQHGEFPYAHPVTWYSGWPLLHLLGVSLSKVSGISVFHIFMCLPVFIGLTSFLFVYLIVERIRKSMGLDGTVTNFALLIYATSPEALFWQTFLVRQNLAILMLYGMIFALFLTTSNCSLARKHKLLALVFGLTLVATHHLTSFVMASFLLLSFVLQRISKYLPKIQMGSKTLDLKRHLASRFPYTTFGVALLMFVSMFLWWGYFGRHIWSFTGDVLTRALKIFYGVEEFKYMPNPSYYPVALTPTWATSLLMLRDILIYAPAFLGVYLLLRKAKTIQGSFVLFSSAAFGLFFFINLLLLRVEMFRIFTMALPFIALLGGMFLNHMIRKKIGIGRLLIVLFSIIVLFASFVGLWGHKFAPFHLYDPSVSSADVGERSYDFMRVKPFLDQKIQVDDIQLVWVDDDASMVSLLNPSDFIKMRRFTDEYIQTHTVTHSQTELMCALKDLNLYFYYSGATSPIIKPEEAYALKYALYQHFDDNFIRIYDDGKHRFWIN